MSNIFFFFFKISLWFKEIRNIQLINFGSRNKRFSCHHPKYLYIHSSKSVFQGLSFFFLILVVVFISRPRLRSVERGSINRLYCYSFVNFAYVFELRCGAMVLFWVLLKYGTRAKVYGTLGGSNSSFRCYITSEPGL